MIKEVMVCRRYDRRGNLYRDLRDITLEAERAAVFK